MRSFPDDKNLLPGVKLNAKVVATEHIVCMVFIMVMLSSLHIYFRHKYNLNQSNLSALGNQLNYISKDNKAHSAEMLNNIALQKAAHKQQVIFKILDSLFHLHATGIYLKEAKQSNKDLMLNGSADSMDAISQFMSEVVSIKAIQAVKLVSIKKEKEQIQFQIQMMEYY